MRLKTISMRFTKPLAKGTERVGPDGRPMFVPRPLTPEQVATIRMMIALGCTEKQIAQTLGRSHNNVQDNLRRLGLKTHHTIKLEKARAEKQRAQQERLERLKLARTYHDVP